MSFIECMKSELDLFKPRHVQTSILKSEEIPYKPLTSLENQSVIEFSCQGHGDTYLDLSSVNLRLKVQLVKGDGTNHKATADPIDANTPGCVNNILHSLFRQVNVSLNGKTVNSADGNYSYRAYIETLMNYGKEASKTHLELGGWYGDDGKVDNLPENKGWAKRVQVFKESGIVELYGKIHADMLNQPLLLLNNINLRIALTLNNPEFYMHTSNATDTSFMKIIEATLYVKHCMVNPNILVAHHKALERTNAKYYYKRCEIKTFTVGVGSSINLDNIVLGQLPTSLIFLMVDNDAYTGKRSKNPFNFKHNDISSFSLFMNGTAIPNDTIITNFKDGSQFARAYSSLFSATGILNTPQSITITKEMFRDGYFLIASDLTPDMSGIDSNSSLLNQGNIRIEARFSKTLERTITCLLFLEYDATLEIDKNRNIIMDH